MAVASSAQEAGCSQRRFLEVIGKEGVVSIVSWNENGAHAANTWNSYLVTRDDDRLLIPAHAMSNDREETRQNNKGLLTVGSKEVDGRCGPGAGFLLEATAASVSAGPDRLAAPATRASNGRRVGGWLDA